MAATNNINPEILLVLLEEGADVTIMDKNGLNILDYIEAKPMLKNTPVYLKIKKMLYTQ